MAVVVRKVVRAWCRRYADAARIRDESHSGLVGWWAGRGEEDAYGHMLHISAGFGCYTGRAYLPRQLTEIRVHCSLASPIAQPYSSYCS
jgi:hypothetical protein